MAEDLKKEQREREEFVVTGKNWLMQHGLVENRVIFEDIYWNCRFVSKFVKAVDLDFDYNKGILYVNLYFSRIGIFLTRKKRLSKKVAGILAPISEYYKIIVQFRNYATKRSPDV